MPSIIVVGGDNIIGPYRHVVLKTIRGSNSAANEQDIAKGKAYKRHVSIEPHGLRGESV